MAEQPVEFIRPGHIIIVVQRRKKQALSKTPGSDEEQIFSFFKKGDTTGSIAVKIILHNDFFKIANPIRKFHVNILHR
jgi:hypothetical protein